MGQNRIRAAFHRGGSSKAVIFRESDLPADKSLRDQLFLKVLGSPDPFQRQLNGMGGGLSSLSKVVVVNVSEREDADLDYTFVQIAVDAPVADYNAMCGNMSASVGPFALEEELINTPDGVCTLSIYNTNTAKIFTTEFQVKDGKAIEEGDFVIPGVAGSGSRISLTYFDPGGAASSGFLPTERVVDLLEVPGHGQIEASLVDATNPVVFIRASDVNRLGTEAPHTLESDTELMEKLELIRRSGAVAMGMAKSINTVAMSNPKIAMIAPAAGFTAIDDSEFDSDTHDISIRIVSMGRIHRAVTLTGAMCLGAATKVPGSLAFECANQTEIVRIANPSGILPVDANVVQDLSHRYEVISVSSFRTQRRLMEGYVCV